MALAPSPYFYNPYSSSSASYHDLGLPIVLEPDEETYSIIDGFHDGMRASVMSPTDDAMKEVQVPTHPISSMQGAFAESMLEASDATTSTVPKNAIGNASARRKHLLDQDLSEETHAARWRPKSNQQHHQLWKLMAQISFGMYLLLNGIAKDDEQVMTILQGHVDEIDEFLETTLEDFDLALSDINERLKFLKLPLENIVIFDAMLEDRNFRLQIVNGNERIEHVITRTATAMNDALKDVQEGMNACKQFTIYLAQEQEDPIWRGERPDMQKVFDAMKGNVEGWYKAYVSLQTKGNHLGVALVQLGSIIAEMDRRAGEVSRKKRFSMSPTKSPPGSTPSSPPQQSQQIRQSMLKTLPSDPSQITPAIQAALPAFQLVQERERSPEPDRLSTSSSELDMLEPEFLLKPHTYSPIPTPQPSPKPAKSPIDSFPTPPEITAPPEITKRSSLRNRFSLKRKETPAEIPVKPASPDGYSEQPQQVNKAPSASTPRTLNTPPSRGLDSAYCSDFEKASPPGMRPALQQTYSHQSQNSARTQPIAVRDFNYVHSPRSDQQYFKPVKASPHSPLQRPWTAGPTNPLHSHSNSSASNLSTLSTLRGHGHKPSALGNRRGAPSAMGMSVMSDMTMMTEIGENGEKKKIKKKRSAFGWLKKAFSLSEEEKAEFEEKRRAGDRGNRDGYRDAYYERPSAGQQRWVDGRRVR